MIEKEHYIGDSHIFGKQIKYIIQSEKEGIIGVDYPILKCSFF